MTLDQFIKEHELTEMAFGLQVGLTQSYVHRLRRRLVHPLLGTALKIQDASKGEIDIRTLIPLKDKPRKRA